MATLSAHIECVKKQEYLDLPSIHEDRTIIFIRFNPDKYTKQDNTVPSCWTLNKKGLCVLKPSMKKEWTTRLLGLQESIIYWTKNVPSEMLTIRYLFYNEL